MTRKKAIDVILFLYVFLFVYAAISKFIDFQKFVIQLGQSPMLTNHAKSVAWAVPTLELLIAANLIAPCGRLTGLYAALSLMAMFTTYIVLASQFADHVPCSCGGIIQNLSWTEHLFFNVAFLLLAAMGILLIEKDKRKTAGP